MFYSIRHVTRFRYSGPVRESVMELRMQPRSEGPQTLRSFQISTNPRAQLYAYTDHWAMRSITSICCASMKSCASRPRPRWKWAPFPLAGKARCPGMGPLQRFNLTDDHFDMLEPSRFARPSPELLTFMKIADLEKPVGDPLTALQHPAARPSMIPSTIESGITEVNSPIEMALDERRGVCQDFAHIMIAIARAWGVPTRYVSGYIYHKGSKRPFRRRRHPCLGGSLSAVAGLGGL